MKHDAPVAATLRPSALLGERAQRSMLVILTLLALFSAAYYAQNFLEPVVFGVVLGVVVAPLADRLDRFGISRAITASILLILVVGLLFLALVLLQPLVAGIAEQWPKIRSEIQQWIWTFSDFLRGIETISEEIENTVGSSEGSDGESADIPTVMDAVWMAPDMVGRFFIFIGTLFFFVLTRDRLYRATRQYCDTLFDAERVVSRYFALVTLINIALATATALGLFLLEVPGALLWGLAAGVLNFILYLGPLIMACSLLVAGLIAFTGPMVLAPPALFLTLNIIEAQFITPSVVGQKLDMNPLIVFLAVTFGLWIWGPIGAIVALPLVIWGVVFFGKKMPEDEDASLFGGNAETSS